jgi:predicted trehalose synthase
MSENDVSKTRVKELRKALEAAITAQILVVKKARAFSNAAALINDSLSDLAPQIDILGNRIAELHKMIQEMEGQPS